MPPIPEPTDKKLCPFLKTRCLGAECALFLGGYRICAITFNAINTGNILDLTEKRS